MPTKYKLTYFDSRGFGEPIRLIFAQAGIEYEDKRFNREEWDSSLKSTSPTGQAPMLEIDGVVYTQSLAIARYLAKQFGLAGKTALEDLKIDMIVDTLADMVKLLGPIFQEKDEEKKAALSKTFEKEQLPTTLQNLEKMHGGDGFFVGSQVTWADIVFMHYMSFPQQMGIKIDWRKSPKLEAVKDRVAKLPKIAQWIENRPKTQF